MSDNNMNEEVIPQADEVKNLRKDVDTLHGVVESFAGALTEAKPLIKLAKKKNIVKKVIQMADQNGDGVTTPKEFISWGGEMLNGQGFKMLLITLLSITFDYLYGYIISLLDVVEGSVLILIGKLIAFSILTYGYKTVLEKVDGSKGDMAVVIRAKNEEIEKHKQDKQANRLTIELLRHDNNNLTKENEYLKKEVARLQYNR